MDWILICRRKAKTKRLFWKGRYLITRAELDRAWPDIMAAPKDGAAIEMLCLRPAMGERRFVDEIHVTREEGIPGERWLTQPWMRLPGGQPDPAIQVSFLQRRVLDLVWRDREGTPHPGDTFVVDMDLSEANLPAGSLLQVGSAVLEVSTVFNNACAKWKKRYGDDALDWVRAYENKEFRPRGVLAKVHRDGVFRAGDRLTRIG